MSSWRWLLVLVLPLGSLILLGEYLRRRYDRQQQPTLVEDWRRFMERPVIIKGKARQPRLKRLRAKRPKLHAVRKTGTL